MSIPGYKSKQELIDGLSVVQRFEPVNAEAPNRGINENSDGRDFLALYHRLVQTAEFASTPNLLWNGVSLIISGSDLVISYVIEDMDSAVPVQRTTTIQQGTYSFGANGIMTVPLGIDADSVIVPGGGQAKFYANDGAAQQALKAVVDSGARADAFRVLVFARKAGTALRLFNRLTLRQSVQVTNGFRDEEYAGDNITLLTRRFINQDRGLIAFGGGNLTWVVAMTGVGTITAATPLKLALPGNIVNTLSGLHLGGVSLSAAVPYLVCTLNRTASATIAPSAASAAAVLSSADNLLTLAYYDAPNGTLHWFEGTRYRPSDSFPLGIPSAVDPAIFIEQMAPYDVYPTAVAAFAGVPPASTRVVWVSTGGFILRPETYNTLNYSFTAVPPGLNDVNKPSASLVAGSLLLRCDPLDTGVNDVGIVSLYGGEVTFKDTALALVDIRSSRLHTNALQLDTGSILNVYDSAGAYAAVVRSAGAGFKALALEDAGEVPRGVFKGELDVPMGDHVTLRTPGGSLTDSILRVGAVGIRSIRADQAGADPESEDLIEVRSQDGASLAATLHTRRFWADHYIRLESSGGFSQLRIGATELRVLSTTGAALRDLRASTLRGVEFRSLFAGSDATLIGSPAVDVLQIDGAVSPDAVLRVKTLTANGIAAWTSSVINVTSDVNFDTTWRIQAALQVSRVAAGGGLPARLTLVEYPSTTIAAAIHVRDVVLQGTTLDAPRLINNHSTEPLQVRSSIGAELPLTAKNTAKAWARFDGVLYSGQFNIASEFTVGGGFMRSEYTLPAGLVANITDVVLVATLEGNTTGFLSCEWVSPVLFYVYQKDSAGTPALRAHSVVLFGLGS